MRTEPTSPQGSPYRGKAEQAEAPKIFEAVENDIVQLTKAEWQELDMNRKQLKLAYETTDDDKIAEILRKDDAFITRNNEEQLARRTMNAIA